MGTPDFIFALRKKIGNDPLWLSSVTAVVVRDDQILLAKRADNGEWTPVTGIIDPGEQPADAAAREVLEETGIVAVPQRLAMVHVTDPVVYDNGDQTQYLDLVFRFGWQSGVPSASRRRREHSRRLVPAGRPACDVRRHAQANRSRPVQRADSPVRLLSAVTWRRLMRSLGFMTVRHLHSYHPVTVRSPRSLTPMTVRSTQENRVDLRQYAAPPLSLTLLSRNREIATRKAPLPQTRQVALESVVW
ncbi:NUDIX domain-containing protein [Streptomyces sp. NPDC088752]|uniref:NUDIX hydrolase n=1 Tax=Streptomyces sp. NPDC088752 TaxID=3154963 RepID=UPI0034312D0F